MRLQTLVTKLKDCGLGNILDYLGASAGRSLFFLSLGIGIFSSIYSHTLPSGDFYYAITVLLDMNLCVWKPLLHVNFNDPTAYCKLCQIWCDMLQLCIRYI